MKTIHLLCNAHIDPVWLWQREEGVAEAISTFRTAADFCEKYDGFVFNHNESFLYECVEENEPQLFERIKKLVKAGKWHIMGGWYLQPDCVMTSGESLIRQIETGNKYFAEKFGVKPTTAINFDPFGHSRGLVQILKKYGYDAYLFMRPLGIIPENNFIWKGFDGSEVIGHCMTGVYSSIKGQLCYSFDWTVKEAKGDINLMLWGIGNHGGGPSEVDLKYIEEYIDKHPEMKIIHSWCENYFSEIDTSLLKTFEGSLVNCMVGCYTSMARIKKLHRKLECELNLCEKMLAASGIEYDKEELAKAEKALMFCQFHDILPGTSIKEAEEDSVRLLEYGREIVSKINSKAFFSLCGGQKKSKDGEVPILVFNPHPYYVEKDIEAEFMMANKNPNEGEMTVIHVKKKDGEYLPAQNEKESCTLNLDWRKKVAFRTKLKPMSINRFDCELEVKKRPVWSVDKCKETETHFVVETEKMSVHINKSTGLIDKYAVNGFDFLKSGSAKIEAYKDDEDPWAMNVYEFTDKTGEFKTLSKEEANIFNGYIKADTDNVRVIENGDVRVKIQAVFKFDKSYAIVTYTIPKSDAYIDLKIKMLSNNTNVMYKLVFDTNLENSDFIGQTAFGREKLLKNNKESVYHKWCGLFESEKNFLVLNRQTYGGSAYKGKLYISLLRTPVYSAHPVFDREYVPHDRFNEHIDMGEREFEFRIMADEKYPDKEAEIYNQPEYILSFFASGEGEADDTGVYLDNENIILSCYKKTEGNKYLLRLFNSSGKPEKGIVDIFNKEHKIELNPYEFKDYFFER